MSNHREYRHGTMGTQNMSEETPPSEILVKASATPRYAFLSLLNLGMIFVCSYGIVLTWLIGWSSQNWIALLITLPFIAMLIYYIWAILSRTMEVQSGGIKYDEALTKRFFKWEEIGSVLIEGWKRQITFETKGKRVRIHYIGVHPKEFAAFKGEFLNQLQKRNIPLVEK